MGDWAAGEEITADKLNSRRGFKSRARAHTDLQLYIPTGNNDTPLDFNIEDFDSNDEFDCPAQRTGVATATSAGHLIDTTKNQFVPEDVGRWVYNSTDHVYTRILAYNSSSDVSVSYFAGSGKGYRIFGTKYTAKVAGYYQLNFQASLGALSAEDYIRAIVKKNNSIGLCQVSAYVSSGGANAFNNCPSAIYSDIVYLDIGDYLEFFLAQDDTSERLTNTVDVYFSIQMVSEP